MNAVNLKTEYLRSPIGIDIVRPRFSWNCEGGSKQTAYLIIAKVNGETVWNSGKVESSSMTHIPYEGRPLKAKERVIWSVKLWDENGEGGLGFVFNNYNGEEFLDAVVSCLNLYHNNREGFQALQRTDMSQDFSWDKPAARYLDLFLQMCQN